MADVSGGKRITLKRNRPNPIFEDWLKELHEEAKSKKSKLESMLEQALESITKYPLPLKSGAECAILKGFDKKLCKFLDMRLKVYSCNMNDSVESPQASNSQEVQSDGTESISRNNSNSTTNSVDKVNSQNGHKSDDTPSESSSVQSKKKGGKRPRVYKPVFRSGSYAILIALLEQMQEGTDRIALEKQQLIDRAQPHSEESFVRPKPESFYTAWSNMKTLISKGLVICTRSKKTVYSLSDEGIALAIQLLEDYKDRPTVNDMIFNGASASNSQTHRDGQSDRETASGSTSSSQQDTITPVLSQASTLDKVNIELPAGSFDVILLIDKHETGGVSKRNDPTTAQFKKYPDLMHEYRSLKVGDFTWIARHKINKDEELVLPYIVERKRMDDLGASIKDGRFHEQKFRLRKCGLKNVIYLVENFGSNKHVGLPVPSLMQALANTRVQDGFKVHMTDSLSNSARYLAMMTKRLTVEFKDKNLKGSNRDLEEEELMTFNSFNKSSSKNKPLTVTETFIKMLLQLKGLSVEKALAITKMYPTPKSLITEYDKCSRKEGEMLLANLKYGELSRNVGPSVSKAIYKFLTWNTDSVLVQ